MVASLEMVEAVTHVPAPAALTRAMPPPGSVEAPLKRKPKYALPAPSTVTGVSAKTVGSLVEPWKRYDSRVGCAVSTPSQTSSRPPASTAYSLFDPSMVKEYGGNQSCGGST